MSKPCLDTLYYINRSYKVDTSFDIELCNEYQEEKLVLTLSTFFKKKYPNLYKKVVFEYTLMNCIGYNAKNLFVSVIYHDNTIERVVVVGDPFVNLDLMKPFEGERLKQLCELVFDSTMKLHSRKITEEEYLETLKSYKY